MARDRRRSAFTLIEVLIVVIIMAVLAATIIPQFSSSTNDAKDQLAAVQSAHDPVADRNVQGASLGQACRLLTTFADQMTKPTNVNGETTGDNLIYGPYFQGQVPTNPFNGSNTLGGRGRGRHRCRRALLAGGAGWQYDESNGSFFPNNSEYYAAQQPAQQPQQQQ